MKFDFAIGNPPYQDEAYGENNYAPPVYDRFMDAAFEVAEKVELIHPARFLFRAGSTPKSWNEKMLEDNHFKVLLYEEDCKNIFSNTEIKGGIAISYRDNTKDFGAIGTYTPYNYLNSILKKASPKEEKDSLVQIIFLQNRFVLDVLYNDYPEYKRVIGSEGKDRRFRNNIFDKVDLFTDAGSKDDFSIIGVIKNKRVWRYINSKYVEKSHENLYKWKVLVVRVNGNGSFGEVLSSPIIAKPQEGYTQTFIGIGAFDNRVEAENTLKYIKTKFSRAMLGILKKTQDNNRDTWKYVPLQDFTPSSDIDWSKSIQEIDQQLYRKYGLSQEEIDFIETNVKEMV